MAKPAQKSTGNKSVVAGENPFVQTEGDEAGIEELDEEEEEEEELDEEDELEEELEAEDFIEDELEEVEAPPKPKKVGAAAVPPPKKPVVKPVVKVTKPVAAKPVAKAKVKAPPKAETDEDSTRQHLAPETRVALTDVGRSLNGKGCHDAIATILRARKSGSITVGELLTKLPAAFVPRTAQGTETYYRGYIGAAIRRGYLTIAA